MATFQQKILNMLKCFRRQWCLFADSERTTVCGADCMMMALQLSMAEVNKQLHGDFTVSLSDVVETWKYLLHDKLGLTCENMEAPENYADIKKTYDTFLKRSNMLDLIDICRKCHTLTSESEIEEMSPVKLLKFISGLSEENGSSLSIPSTPIRHSQDNVKLLLIVKKFVYAYLSLLVNSKNDLAMAHVLNIPDRGLGREAFTDLKHAAQKRQMSIFLMATSFIRMMELGGKGYAPSPFDTLRTHIKGLSDFVNFIDKLEEIIGEVLDPRSPAQSTRSSPKPLRQRIKTSVGERKIKMKQPLIRSQFACTYKDDVMTEKKDQHFFSRSQIPTCIHPAPKRILALCLEAETFAEGVKSPPERPALGTSSGNVHRNGSKSEKAKSCQPRNKNSKRKHMDLNSEQVICSNENEPLQYTNIKRPKISNILQKKLDSKLDGAAKSNKAMAKNKLIAGQKKLTDFFFRL
ncbi:PCNA-interacting partner isoform X5 [Dermochelys coriacea]|uniref:PCNA-interacting partner isoform X5 n=1 Tax=Dermochelys coriacea TaxID=27794 RepID=UPI001CA8A4AE|nr:PCNA-interacting partner isoform X5 [Dermochelys coriacea]